MSDYNQPKPQRPFSGRFPVRAFTSGIVHLADLADSTVDSLMSFGVPCFGGVTPIVTVCTAVIARGQRGGWVVMAPDVKVTCVSCSRLDHRTPMRGRQ